jgi:hypothetical protein
VRPPLPGARGQADPTRCSVAGLRRRSARSVTPERVGRSPDKSARERPVKAAPCLARWGAIVHLLHTEVYQRLAGVTNGFAVHRPQLAAACHEWGPHNKRLARSYSLAFNIRQLSVRCRVAKFTNKRIYRVTHTKLALWRKRVFPRRAGKARRLAPFHRRWPPTWSALVLGRECAAFCVRWQDYFERVGRGRLWELEVRENSFWAFAARMKCDRTKKG